MRQAESAPWVANSEDRYVNRSIRVTPQPELSAVLWGMAPLIFTLLVMGMLLWGAGHDVPLAGNPDRVAFPAGRSVAAWLAVISLLIVFAHSLLRPWSRFLRGRWSPRIQMLEPWATRLQIGRRHRLLTECETDYARAAVRETIPTIKSVMIDAVREHDVGDDASLSHLVSLIDEAFALGAVATGSGSHTDRASDQIRLQEYFFRAALDKLGDGLAEYFAPDVAVQLEAVAKRTWKGNVHPKSGRAWPANSLPPGQVAVLYPMTGKVRPTLLGNVEDALEDRLFVRYAMDAGVVWPRLLPLIPVDKKATLAKTQRMVDMGLYRGTGWLIAAGMTAILACWLLLSAWAGSGSGFPWVGVVAVLGSLGMWVLFKTGYREAVRQTIVLGQQIESTVDLHRFDLLDAIGWRRPSDVTEEHECFAELSRMLGGESEAGGRFRSTSETPSGALVADVRGALDAISSLPETIDQALTAGLAGPALVNYDGYMTVRIVGTNGNPVVTDEEGRFLISMSQSYEVTVRIGPTPGADSATARIRVRGGEDHPIIPFGIGVDSNVVSFRQDEREVEVDKNASVSSVFSFRLDGSEPAESSLWVRVTQRDRTVQNLQIPMIRIDVN
jgi:hypothetical protein